MSDHFFPSTKPNANVAKNRRRPVDLVSESVTTHPELLTSRQALDQLGVKRQTLYAYVSRGLIRTARSPRSTEYLYFREDVETVALKGRQKGTHEHPAERALKWGGTPVLESSITRLTEGGPYYRGTSAIELAKSNCSFERCAELLWSSKLPFREPIWPRPRQSKSFSKVMVGIESVAPFNNARRLMILVLEGYAAALGDSWIELTAAPEDAARQLIAVLATSFSLLGKDPIVSLPRRHQPIADLVLQSAKVKPSINASRALNACLVLCADHELATATFVARISASAGANILSCVTSALSSSEGMLAGIDCDACERLLTSVNDFQHVETLAQLMSIGKAIPGYNHPAYPGGDPRGVFLLEIARQIGAQDNSGGGNFVGLIDRANVELGVAPSVAAGLAAVCNALGMPRGSAGALMALSRSVGWIAHALEQSHSDYLIRPRSKYIGLK